MERLPPDSPFYIFPRVPVLFGDALPDHEPINLIRVFGFYLALMFLISLLRRWDVYLDTVRLVIAVRGRWPRLMERLAEHRSLLLNWAFFRPAVLSFALMVIQMVCSRVIWPRATLTAEELEQHWWSVLTIIVFVLPMLAVDLYFILRVGRFDRRETEKYLDQAETWLGWKGPFVRAVTFGYVNPHRMVDDEVQKSLVELQRTFNSSLYWVSLQIVLRVLFGLALWTVWALHP